jgi:YidC/Oxa1 family membrane protein insertase
MPEPNGKPKELSMETRMILAFILMGGVLFLTPYFYKTPAAPPAEPKPAASAKSATQKAATPASGAPAAGTPAATAAAPSAPSAPVGAVKEESVVLETDLYRAEFTNRGALVKSWILKRYRDSDGKPLDLVSPAGVKRNGYPLSIDIKGREGWAPVNDSLFSVTRTATGVEFEFSDGRTLARKSFNLKAGSYLVEASSELTEGGVAAPHRLVWRGGFGDSTTINGSTTKRAVLFDLGQNKLVIHDQGHAKNGPQTIAGNFAFAGLEDAYFAIVQLPQSGQTTELLTINDMVPNREGKDETVVGGAIGGEGRNRFTFFVGPKDYNLLKSVDRRLEALIDFGWTSFIAKPLFLALKWINDNLVKNWGWSIILVTVVINVLLLPLKISSLKGMRKMSAIQPEVQKLNDKYKGLPLNDPRQQNKNQELMDLYKKHNVNPLGSGCLPLLLQFPFLFAFYAVLSVAIELRHANWLWVPDLAQPETIPLRALPLVMIATQFLLQKMTPSTGMDPTQQRMMLFMPLMFGFMFYGASSGLVLYWLTGNVIAIAQQWVFNKTMPAPAAPVAKAPITATPKKKSGR